MTISPMIRLSETLAYGPSDEAQSIFAKSLQRLAIDGQLEVHGQHVWIIGEFEEQISGWQVVDPAGLVAGEWDWAADMIRFDPNQRPDYGVNPRYLRQVSFIRAELFDWLERPQAGSGAPRRRARGRPSPYDWKKIASIARSMAAANQYTSENHFFGELAAVPRQHLWHRFGVVI